MTTSVSPTSMFHRHRFYPYHRRLAPVLLAALCFCLLPGVVAAQLVTPASHIGPVCLAIADELDPGQGGSDPDTLVQLDRNTGQTQIIGQTGTTNIEDMAFGPGHQLYAADGGQLGIVNIATGQFTALSQPAGTGSGSEGSIVFNNFDGLTYVPDEHIFYATHRRGLANDLLVALDPDTGAHIPDHFGPGIDYLVVPTLPDEQGDPLPDVDGLARDPVTGIIYAAINDSGRNGVLATLDVTTGVPTRIATMRYPVPYPPAPALAGTIIDDIEAISFFNDGQLYASTGDNGPDPIDLNSLFQIDTVTGVGVRIGRFPAGTKDIEALGCLTAEAHIVLKKYTNGPGQPPADADTPTGPQIPEGETVTWTYIITNTGLLTLTDLSLVDNQIGGIGPGGPINCPAANDILGPGESITCTATGVAQPGQYANIGTVTALTELGLVAPRQTVSDTDPSHYFGVSPGIAIRKFTNGQDANDPNGSDVPVIAPNGAITWTYRVTNTGSISLTTNEISVSDDRIGPITTIIDKGDGDDFLAPGEAWTYAATGVALDLTTTDAMTLTVPGCNPTGTGTTRPTYENTGIVTARELIAADPSHYCNPVVPPTSPLTAIGDRAWFDTNQNGLQDDGEAGVANVTVNLYRVGTATPISTTTTSSEGIYMFSLLPLGDYFVEFVPPANHTFTVANAQNNSQDAADSDAAAPVVAVGVSDNGINASLGQPLTYTISYTNTSANAGATGVLIQLTVPTGTTADLAASSPGWSCGAIPAVGGTACQLSVGAVAPGATGNVQFVVVLGTDDDVVPTTIELTAGLAHTTPGRTHVTTPPAESADLTLDAGFIQGEQRQTSRVGTVRRPGNIPTNLDETDQPGQPNRLRLYAPLIAR
ncbi:MAG TPA: SdrD B-like domain-containing protein [Caldilineaceae bacterium]|nr:SdrD B-like domain-containing protein [Caldilineaceae bacterium]